MSRIKEMCKEKWKDICLKTDPKEIVANTIAGLVLATAVLLFAIALPVVVGIGVVLVIVGGVLYIGVSMLHDTYLTWVSNECATYKHEERMKEHGVERW